MKGLQAGSISALRHVLLSVRTDTGQGEPLSEDAVSKHSGKWAGKQQQLEISVWQVGKLSQDTSVVKQASR